MLHRALFGSLERFAGILIEHYAGNLPLWLAPVQAVVATVVSDADDHARECARRLEAAGLRARTDLRNETISYKVRQHSLAKVPAILVAGRKEAEDGTVTVRRLGTKRQETLPVETAIARLAAEVEAKSPPPGVRLDEAAD